MMKKVKAYWKLIKSESEAELNRTSRKIKEEEKKLKFRRSIVSNTNLKKGHKITSNDLSFKRPGIGIPPDKSDYVIGRKLNKDVKGDELIM